ncbi:MAG TPA: AAA family ATPase [Trinickia sp.]|jgi:pilus assembly protein CpaE|uniref:AAA family ATPase n=1 Tax=Trinickia sp. TaxID=2571163 RepID=UPI002CCE0CBB|nr:AAA family ATPase [Trinickia sp.]HTI18085.1 AAA family ATPase [Trinickia sp.]
MIDILSISKDASRLAQVMRLISECGAYRTTRTLGSPSQLAARGGSLESFDVLIVDALTQEDAELSVIAELCQRHDRLTCILLTGDASPQTLIAAMRAGFRDVLPWPLDQRTLADALMRAEKKQTPRDGAETQIISFMSCKGGAGTTFISTNIAHAISVGWKKRVLLVDLNQLYGDAAFLVTSETPASTLPQMCAQIERMDSAFLDASLMRISETFDVIAGAGDPVKAAQISSDKLEWILGIAIPRYDVVIFDIGQSINQLSILALDRSKEIHLVLQPSMPHARAGRRLMEILSTLGYPADRMRLLLNRHSRRAQGARDALEQILNTSPYQVLPEDDDIVADALNEGVPVSEIKRNSAVARALQQLAEKIVSQDPVKADGRGRSEFRLPRLFGGSPTATPKLKTM